MRSLLGEAWITASLLLAGVSVLAESVWLFGVAAMVLATGGAARLWARLSLEEVHYRRRLVAPRAFVGEELEAELSLANEKRLPVPWVEVRETLPEALPADTRVRPAGIPGMVTLERSAALAGGERVRWPVTFRAKQRGYYRLGPATVRSGDLFGLFEEERIVPSDTAAVVYPRTVPLPGVDLPSARPFGERRGGNRLFEDPVYFRGLRDYLPGDSLRRIDWKATARAGRPQSRVYESSHTPAVVVALNVSTLEHSWQGHDPVLLERAIVLAASVARQAFEARSAVGLLANGAFADADRAIRLGAGRSPDQLVRVLEALAMVTPFATGRLAAELDRPGEALPAGATVCVVSAVVPPDLAAALRRLREQGHAVLVLTTQTVDVELPGVRLVDLSPLLERLEAQWAQEEAQAAARDASRAGLGAVIDTPGRGASAAGTGAGIGTAPTGTAPEPDARREPPRRREPSSEEVFWAQRAERAQGVRGARDGDTSQEADPGGPDPESPDPESPDREGAPTGDAESGGAAEGEAPR